MKIFVISFLCGLSRSVDPTKRVSIDLRKNSQHVYYYETTGPLVVAANLPGSVPPVLKTVSPISDPTVNSLLELPNCDIILTKFATPQEVSSEEEWRKLQVKINLSVSTTFNPWKSTMRISIKPWVTDGLTNGLWNSSKDGKKIVLEYVKAVLESLSMRRDLFRSWFSDITQNAPPPDVIGDEWKLFAQKIDLLNRVRDAVDLSRIWMPRTVARRVLGHRNSCFRERLVEFMVARGVWQMPANLAQLWTEIVTNPEQQSGLTSKVTDMYTEMIAAVGEFKHLVQCKQPTMAELLYFLTGGQLSGNEKFNLKDYPFALATQNMFLVRVEISESMLQNIAERSIGVQSRWEEKRWLTKTFQDPYEIAVVRYLNGRSENSEIAANNMVGENDTNGSEGCVIEDGDANGDAKEDPNGFETYKEIKVDEPLFQAVEDDATVDDCKEGENADFDISLDDSPVITCFQDRSGTDHFVGVLESLKQVLTEYRDYHLIL